MQHIINSIEKYGFYLERHPAWMSPSNLELARSVDSTQLFPHCENLEPGSLRVYGAFGKIPDFRPLITQLALSNTARSWFGSRPMINFTLFRNPTAKRGRQLMHRDCSDSYENHSKKEVVALIYLDDSNCMNGGTSFVPGSHKDTRSGAKKGRLTPEMPAGSVAWFTPTVLHGGKRNRSGKSRRILLVSLSTCPIKGRRSDGDHNPDYLSTMTELEQELFTT